MQIPENLLNEHFDDRYFDVIDALDEAQQIHFKNNSLLERITAAVESNTTFIIGETGFGAGRVVISLMEYLEREGLTNVSLEYNSVELYPLSPERMLNILDSFKERVDEGIDTLVNAYKSIDITVSGWHSMKIQQSFGTLTINLWIGEALEMVKALKKPCDVWFLDGHSPKKNPSIWRPELLLEIGKKTKLGGTCSTFTVAGAVRRGLEEAGFKLVRHPGCGGKKQVLQGIRV